MAEVYADASLAERELGWKAVHDIDKACLFILDIIVDRYLMFRFTAILGTNLPLDVRGQLEVATPKSRRIQLCLMRSVVTLSDSFRFRDLFFLLIRIFFFFF